MFRRLRTIRSGFSTFTSSSRLRISLALAVSSLALIFSANFLPSSFSAITQSTAGAPRYANYPAPPGLGDKAGEPSIGVNWKTERTFSNSMFSIPNGGTAMYYGGFLTYALKVTFDDGPSPASATWEKKPLPTASAPRVFGDPILFTDHDTGRTFVSQLEGLTPAGSTTDITDDDGSTFMPSEGSGLPSNVDHQTFGGGPYHAPAPPGAGALGYQNAVYYCSQSVADAACSISLDGGRIFGPAIPMFTISDCDGLHGHIKVGADGAAYVPNKGCGGAAPLVLGNEQASIVVSEDNALTWKIRPIPHPTTTGHENDNLTRGDDDPAVGVASDGTIYLGYQSLDGHPRIAVSHDKGVTWSQPYDVGAQVVNGAPVLNTTFPAVVAGDGNRAAFAFYGSETGGDNYACGEGHTCADTLGNNPNIFTGVWYLYIASTFDGGQTWTTQNVTPGDPVQRGGICSDGTCRNQLDFFDATIDKEGRLLVGWDDGCVGGCVNGGANSFTAKATITRQSGGKRMVAAFDPIEPALPGAPKGAGIVNRAGTATNLSWPAPDNGGATITAYKVYRSDGASGPFNLIATVNAPNFSDTNFPAPATNNSYRLTAVNSQGEGPYCAAFTPVPDSNESECVTPGLTKLTDAAGDTSVALGLVTTPAPPGSDLLSFQIAQPFAVDGVPKLVFTINTDAGQSPQVPGSAWYVAMRISGTTTRYKGVHMAWNGTTPTFESYTPGANTSGGVDGRFVTTGSQKAAEPESNYIAPFNKVIIVVKASDLGLNSGDIIDGFVSGVSQSTDPGATVGRGATALYDEMLDGLAFTGTYTMNDNAVCAGVNPTPTPTATPTPAPDGPQTFQGTYDPHPYPCATARHHFDVPAGKARIVVQVNATLPTNDLSVSLLYGSDPNPVLVQKTEDTGTCCEALVYQPASGIPAGEYQVQICQTPTPNGVPQQPPYDYVGTFTVDGTLAPAATPTPVGTPTPIPTPVPVYQKGGITFSPNVATRASVAGRDGEPSLRVDKFGNTYVAGIRGVPAGVDLWYFDLNPSSPTYDPFMRNPIYRGQPDQFSPDESIEVGADGGGDVDLAVGFDESSPGKPPYLAFSSLTAANISTASSTDRGQTFTKNPAGNVTGGIPADDRQWMEFLGKDSVYLIYRTLQPAIALVQRSNDGGLTYGPAREVGTIGQVGGVSVDQTDGTVYIAGGNGVVAVGTPASPGAEPLTYIIHTVAGAGNAHLFFTVKAAKDGTVYVCYSNGSQIFIGYSKDKGNTWSPAARVSDGPETATSIVPWLEPGPTPGSIGVVWYGTTASSNNDNADWKVFFAQSLNATDANPVFRQVELSDHFIHGSNISEQGLPITPGAAPNRNLLDYFQIGFDPTGAAVVAYTDDHNDFDGNVYVARQVSGPGVKGSDVPAPVPGSALPQPTPRPANAPQVTDYAQDSKTGLLTVLPLNDPLDILSVKYSTEGTASNPVLVATMKVSDLSVVPPLSNWRMNFTANAPDSRMSPTGDYSFGLSDRGDQFFVRATTDALGTQTYTYGTAVREHQHRGFVAYTDRGAAESGSFDPAAGTITVKVLLSKLNATMAAGHTPVGPGSVLAGLRGGTFTTGDDNPADRNDRAKSDVARGGTQYAINSAPTAALTAIPTSGAPPLVVNFDGSGSSDPDAGDTLTYTFDFGDGSAPVTVPASNIAHTYNQLGKFTASLTVKDASGFTSNTATVEISVTNRPPTAALSATPTSGYAPLAVNFDGSASNDPDTGDSVSSYTFNFGDGAVVTQSGAKIAHTYNAPGIYTAKLTVADTHGGTSTNTAQVQITVNSRPTTDCMEDDDARITYSDGWHNGTSANASAGHFRWHQGKSPSHTAGVDFSVPANGTGVFSYRYARSTKGGTAEVFIDGVSRGTINYKGSAGSDKSPEFGSGGVAYEARYEGLAAGSHRFELRNMADGVFVDGFCLTVTVAPQVVTSSGGSSGTTTPSSFTGAPAAGPGQSTSNDSSVNAGQESKSNVSLGTNARALSIVAETSGNLPVKLALVSPTGLTLQIVDAVNGVAVLTTPVTQGGIYTVKVININLGPVQVWTVATPTVAR